MKGKGKSFKGHIFLYTQQIHVKSLFSHTLFNSLKVVFPAVVYINI